MGGARGMPARWLSRWSTTPASDGTGTLQGSVRAFEGSGLFAS